MRYTVVLLIMTILAACGTLGGHGMASTARNWYKQDSSLDQTAADLEVCRERSGYNHKIILTTRADAAYSSYVESCMSKAGYEWYQAGNNPRNQRLGTAVTTSDRSPQLSSPTPAAPAKKTTSKEYWSWGLGVAVKTDQNTTVTEFDDVSSSTAKTCIKIGDEIVRVGKENIVSTNAYQILTKKLPTESDDLVTVVVRRDGNDINCRIRPNKFN